LALLTSNSNANAGWSYSGATVGTVRTITPRGLINTGNMCFANSVLQVLVYCPPFEKLFWELGRLGFGFGFGSQEKEKGKGLGLGLGLGFGKIPMVNATVEFLKEFYVEEGGKGGGSKKGKEKERQVNGYARGEGEREGEGEGEGEESFIPTCVYDALKEKKRFDHMRGGQQEDAEEFLGFYLDTLEEELLSIVQELAPSSSSRSAPVAEEREEEAPREEADGWLEVGKKNRTVVTRTIKTAESPITRIFGGKFRSTLRAPGQKDSVIVEDWRSLRLDIQREQIHTIQDALSYISHPQSVQITHPTRPDVVVEASQQVLIEALPPILVLHMKRFCYDTEVGGVVKVGKQVRFGPELDVGGDVMASTIRKQTAAKYKLFGAVYHHGLSASGGHYTLDVLHPNRYPHATGKQPREGWVRIDDELVSDVRSEDVFDATERDDSRCAYLLFYRRIR